MKTILLPAGEKISIGRKSTCNLVINNCLISGVHCVLTVFHTCTSHSSTQTSISDTSSNGTWISTQTQDSQASFKFISSQELTNKAEKLLKGTPRDIYPGDVIMLLAPQHKESGEYRFQLTSADSSGNYSLVQLNNPEKTSNMKRSPFKLNVDSSQSVKKMKITENYDDVLDITLSPASASEREETEMCPTCMDMFPVTTLPIHCPACPQRHEACGVSGDDHCFTSKNTIPKASPIISAYDRCTIDGVKELTSQTEDFGSSLITSPVSVEQYSPSMLELEQCAFCLEDFPVCEMIAHYSVCQSKTSQPKSNVKEQCQHCLNIFPLDDLVYHSINCSQKRESDADSRDGVVRGEEEWGEPVERCMQCFKDFPLSKLVHHSNKCKEELLGPKNRFKDFIPSVHDLDPRTAAVLTPIQRRAIDYVNKKSKADSEAVHERLKKRVVGLGFSEKDLEITLQWIRRDAPIIIHIHLDKCLRFLIKDTHYRNLFETRTGGGGTSTKDRIGWENRIFNNTYGSDVIAFDRVKYGVLNIVGDPRGVQVCSRYGDSFLQLRKVRLRSTFASTDTAVSTARLSCCEHYENVFFQYNESEIKAIIEVATRRKIFLHSDVISDYKEVQIHGPVSLSENVDCIVVNERHKDDTKIKKMLDIFVERTKCNLIWMEPEESIRYPKLH